jgi:glycosyltransferase involved in cell wall biosynthesis
METMLPLASEAVANGPKRWRLAYLVTHPIQYQAPLLRMIAAQPDIDLTVFFQSDLSLREYNDPGFGRAIRWDVPLLEGYQYEFLPVIGRQDFIGSFRPISYGIATRLRQGRFNALWVHGYARWFNWVAMAAAKMASMAVFVRDDITSLGTSHFPPKVWLKREIFFKAFKRICDGYLAVGTLNRQFYLQNGIPPDQIFSMPYCVDNDYFAARAASSVAHRKQLRANLGLEASRPIVLYASKLQTIKRPFDLLAAFDILFSRMPRLRKPYLLVVGDGELRQEMENRSQDNKDSIRFLGFLNQSELPGIFDLSDVFVLPSESDRWGLIVNEAMNARRAVVVSDRVGCAPDLVHDGVNGYVYQMGNVTALADALGKVLTNPDVNRAMGEASFEIIHDWSFQRDIEGLRAALQSAATR